MFLLRASQSFGASEYERWSATCVGGEPEVVTQIEEIGRSGASSACNGAAEFSPGELPLSVFSTCATGGPNYFHHSSPAHAAAPRDQASLLLRDAAAASVHVSHNNSPNSLTGIPVQTD